MRRFFALTFALFFLISSPSAWADSYACPMNCEKGKVYDKMGDCPVCHMKLEKRGAGGRPLNTRDYRLDLATDKALPKAGEKVGLTLSARHTKDGLPLKEVEIVHEKPMHLILVSQDLSWFAHEHPEQSGPGDFKMPFTFPAGGNYVLYADFTPKGERNQVFPLALQVAGDKRPSKALKENTKEKRKLDGGYEVTLQTEPVIKSGKLASLKYRIRKNGTDVKDLEEYLGASGHSVVISEDTTQFLHSHPEDHDHGKEHAHHKEKQAIGPEVVFKTLFPRAGLYKTWGQFNHGGKVITADFVVKVVD